jgi:multidrug efflux pump subunit AcrA (membrane-fusion protein)
MNNTLKILISFAVFNLLIACEDEQATIPTYAIENTEFEIKVSGFGEIEAANAQRILTPGTQAMAIAWLAPENTIVAKGDVIARFDAQQIIRDSRNEELEMLKLQADIVRSEAVQVQQQNDVVSDQVFVQEEFEFVDRFAIDDLRIYSQLEIIDTLQNRDFLEAKDEFLDWKGGSLSQQHKSEIAVLDIQKNSHQAKFERFQSALSQLEVVAPYSGLLVYEKDRRGEKPSIGQTVFPGRPIAKIPNLNDLQAKVFVLANDAIDLSNGLSVNMRLDAFPDRIFSGTINNVSAFPRSIERGNPVTYYEVTVSLDQQDSQIMQPGRKLVADIQVKASSERLVIPLQAIHHENGESYVYVKAGSQFSKSPVSTGIKNQFLVEITQGLSKGDVIALSVPDNTQEES